MLRIEMLIECVVISHVQCANALQRDERHYCPLHYADDKIDPFSFQN